MESSELTDQDLIEELCEIESGLSDWEVSFVESITEQVEEDYRLTKCQRTKALQILEEKGA